MRPRPARGQPTAPPSSDELDSESTACESRCRSPPSPGPRKADESTNRSVPSGWSSSTTHDTRVLFAVQLTTVTPEALRMSLPATIRTSAAEDDCSTDAVRDPSSLARIPRAIGFGRGDLATSATAARRGASRRAAAPPPRPPRPAAAMAPTARVPLDDVHLLLAHYLYEARLPASLAALSAEAGVRVALAPPALPAARASRRDADGQPPVSDCHPRRPRSRPGLGVVVGRASCGRSARRRPACPERWRRPLQQPGLWPTSGGVAFPANLAAAPVGGGRGVTARAVPPRSRGASGAAL